MDQIFSGFTLIDGTGGDPIPEAALHVRDSRIAWVGPLHQLPAETRQLPSQELGGCTVIPGLIDAHIHVCLNGRDPVPDMVRKARDEILLEAVATLRTIIAGGTTTVRDLGGFGYIEQSLRRAIQGGLIPGPRMRTAGKLIAMTGGHGYFMGREADGPEDVRKAAREQIKAGADVIKMMASGGNCTPGQDVRAPQLTVEELAAGVEVAHSLGRTAATHCHGALGIKNSLLAGVDTIEHASYLDEETADLAAERGAALVFTLSVCDARLEDMPPAGWEENRRVQKMLDVLKPRVRQSVDLARQKGLFLGTGGDAGGTLTLHEYRMARELAALVEHGFTPMEAICMATRNNAHILRWEKDLGTLEVGKLADFVVLSKDPLEDIRNLRKIEGVFKGGQEVCPLPVGRSMPMVDGCPDSTGLCPSK